MVSEIAGLDTMLICMVPGTRKLNFIPVVTFLAPLASHFEGLKDR